LLTGERIQQAAGRGRTAVTEATYDSMSYSRGASALAVALALGEVAPEEVDDSAVCRRLDLWSGRASASAGIELMNNEVIVLGQSASWASDCVLAHRVMQDAIDLPAVGAALTDAGLIPAGQPTPAQRDDLRRARQG
jgi:cyanuric acid amidohydrolase